MQTTLDQQIEALMRAKKKMPKADYLALNDAVSTLVAVKTDAIYIGKKWVSMEVYLGRLNKLIAENADLQERLNKATRKGVSNG